MDEPSTPLTPIITLKEPQFKAIDTCQCCGSRDPGQVMQLRFGWSQSDISQGSAVSTILCRNCLCETAYIINLHIARTTR